MTLTHTVDPSAHTVTLRGQQFAADIITRPADHVRAGVQVVIDDDANGAGVTTRLHVYGVDGWRELVTLVRAVNEEIERMMSEEITL